LKPSPAASSFHGSAFEYLRNDSSTQNPGKKAPTRVPKLLLYKKHDFGYTIGGPVYIPQSLQLDKKKISSSSPKSGAAEKNPHTTGPVNVPSDAERSGNFTDLCRSRTVFYHDASVAPSGAKVFQIAPLPDLVGSEFVRRFPQ